MKLLDNNKKETLSTAKRLLSIVAGAYIFQRGIRSVTKHPVTSIQGNDPASPTPAFV
jgi:hypothetical protein